MAKTYKLSLFVGCFLFLSLGMAFYAQAQTGETRQQKRTYTEVILDEKTSDASASAIVQKVLSADLEEMKGFDPREPLVLASFQSLGPDLPKNAIFAYIFHPSVCGSSGCRTVILNPNASGKYDVVFDTTLGRIFKNIRSGKTYFDILTTVMPRASDGFGVFFWNEEKKIYVFAGISKFEKK
ncbi:MAG: hypothetical protein EBQ96_03895 [Proteobacteria bacterium]|nr:hypothetical protein [Pseudomonadota bacterium]